MGIEGWTVYLVTHDAAPRAPLVFCTRCLLLLPRVNVNVNNRVSRVFRGSTRSEGSEESLRYN